VSKSYENLQKQIASLQREADALKAKEIGGVVARIREAIDHYGLTPEEVFGTGPAKRGRKLGAVPKRVAKSDLPAVKYRDEAGNAWSGRGPRPGWFKAAIESGKNIDDYLVK
jgi:DNA-binding protein H-NS